MSNAHVHPSDWQLAGLVDDTLDGPDADRVRNHVGSCMRCRGRVGRDRGLFDVDPDRFLTVLNAEGDRPAVAGWLQAALAARRRPDPRPGQIWHLTGGGLAALALVHRVSGERALVVPVTLETELADEYAVLVNERHSPVDAPLALWISLSTLVDNRTLDTFVCDSDLDHDVQVVRDDFVHGRPTESIRTGHPIHDVLDPRWRYREHLKATFASLSAQPADTADRLTEVLPAADTEAGDHLSRAVRAEIEYAAPQARTVADPEATVVDAVAGPLRPALVVVLADLRIRVAIASAADSTGHDGTAEAANLLGLLGDCDRLAVVHPDDEFPTRLLDPYDLNESFETPSGTRRQARLVDPEPLNLVFGGLQQEYLTPHGMFADVDLDKVDVDLSSVTGTTALDALHEQAARRWTGEKKEEFEKLGADDAAAIAAFIEDSPQRATAAYDDEYDTLIARRAA